MKTTAFPIVFETEDNGTVSAAVTGLPVFAAADTRHEAEIAITEVLAAYLEAHPDTPTPKAAIRVARVEWLERTSAPRVRLVGAAALLGGTASRRKSAAARRNGRKGGRPRKVSGLRKQSPASFGSYVEKRVERQDGLPMKISQSTR